MLLATLLIHFKVIRWLLIGPFILKLDTIVCIQLMKKLATKFIQNDNVATFQLINTFAMHTIC